LSEAAGQPAPQNASGVVRKMEGLMWYNMLSEMNKSGLDSSTLGTGSDAFQSLFLWNIAENDFGKYDGGLVSATLRQIGGRASPAPALAPSELSPAETAPDGAGGATAGAVASQTGGAVGDAVLLAHATDLTRAIWPALRMAASVLGVPPVGLLAQAALETGWGSAMPGNNLFGIKAAAGQTATPRATHEMVDGSLLPETANFRDYGSPLACITDYIRLIQTNFQNVIGQGSVADFANAMQAGGFATDSNYASKIIMISQSPMMQQMLQAVGVGDATTD
jgi:flagellar protein FlgJ